MHAGEHEDQHAGADSNSGRGEGANAVPAADSD